MASKMITYNFIEDIFEDINSSEKAYWIGFLYADGSINSTNYGISIALQEKDKQQLINFENFLHLIPSCLKYQKETCSWRFNVTRKKMHNDLMSLGFTSQKSYDNSTIVWDNIPKEYKKDFILGLWDGDGSFGIATDGTQLASVISNNDTLIRTIVDYINLNLGKDFCKVKARTPGDPYPRIRLVANKAKLFGDWLYANITYPSLQRKYDIYKTFQLGSKSHPGVKNPMTKGIICIDNGKAYATAKECCLNEFGIDIPGAINSIRMVCRGERTQTRGRRFRYMTDEEKEGFINGEFNF